MSVVVTPFIYINDGENAHSYLLDVLESHPFSDIAAAQEAMDGLRAEVAASVFGPLLTVEFDID